jgi:hypothetical protein
MSSALDKRGGATGGGGARVWAPGCPNSVSTGRRRSRRAATWSSEQGEHREEEKGDPAAWSLEEEQGDQQEERLAA